MGKGEQRLRLYDLYKKNLSHYTEGGRDFICPLCTKSFPRTTALAGPTLEVDIAHCYPKSCGGRLETLTCKYCNNEMGHNYETHLAKESKLYRAFDPAHIGSVNGRLTFPNGDVGVEVSRDTGGMNLKIVARQTDPASIDAFKAHMSRGGDIELRMDLDYFSQSKAAVALGHSAFLMMFREFGYEFALSPLAEKLRQIIVYGASANEDMPLISIIPDASFDPRLMNQIGIAESEDGFRCFYLLFPNSSPESKGRCVLLPGMENDANAAYRKLVERGSGKMRFVYRPIGGKSWERLGQIAFRCYLRCCWTGIPVEKMLSVETLLAVHDLACGSSGASSKVADISSRAGLPEDVTRSLLQCLKPGLISFDITADQVFMTDSGIQAARDFLVFWVSNPSQKNG